MSTTRAPRRVTSLVGAIVMLLPVFPVSVVMAEGKGDPNRPVEITFTKWGVPAPPPPAPQPPFGLFEGFSGDGLPGSFNAEVLWRQASLNGHVAGLEAMYEVVDGDRSFTALIRGGSNQAGLGLLDGVILAGWRTGARVQVVFQRRLPSEGGCAGAPVGRNCFEGVIYVGRAPKD